MRKNPTYALVAGGLVLCLPAALAGKPPPTATVLVDCTDPDPRKHGSINEALETPADELTVEIRGLCQERVVVTRDWVTLEGGDPDQDGIFGPGPSTPDFFSNALLVTSGEQVRIENLKITGAARRGVSISESDFVELVNCRVVDNDRLGVVVGSAAGVEVRESVVSGNPRAAVVVLAASQAQVENSELSDGYFGLLSAVGGSQIRAFRSTVSATWPVVAAEYGLVYVFGGELTGGLWADNNGTLALYGVEQTANPTGSNLVYLDSTLQLRGWQGHGSAILGPTYVEDFSKMLIRGGSTHDGNLICISAGDAFCDDAAINLPDSGSSSNCGQCPKP